MHAAPPRNTAAGPARTPVHPVPGFGSARALAAAGLLLLALPAAGAPAAGKPAATRKPAVARAAAKAPADSLPVAGVFAPVAARYQRDLAALGRLPAGAVTPLRLHLLLRAGRVDEAYGLLGALKGDSRAAELARLRVLLARQEFAAAAPLAQGLGARPDRTEPEARTWYAWLYAHDDAARIDTLSRGASLAPGTTAPASDLLWAGRLAYDLLNYARAESCFTRVIERTEPPAAGAAPVGGAVAEAERLSARASALTGLALVLQKRRDYDASLEKLTAALDADPTPKVLDALVETLIRLGRTDEAIGAATWACRLDPYDDLAHYYRGNGYTRRTYTQLYAAYPRAFADAAGRAALARADSLLAAGVRAEAREAYEAVRQAHPGWADALVRLASLDFEDGRQDEARTLCFQALALCPEYGRAHAVLAKALEFQRFDVDVHRAGYEARFGAVATPEVPGIDRFVANWASLPPRVQKRVALSLAPFKQYIPVLIEGGSDYYIKPMYMLLSETPGLETLRDQRIDYDSRLWDDVRGAGGYRTVTGIEDVERTIFDRYNTVLHEFTHQVHSVLTADLQREIQELYRKTKERDQVTKDAFLSRYAAGAVAEYLAEGENALFSPRRDAYDPRDVVRERLDERDPALRALLERLMAVTDVTPFYPVAYANAGDDRVERGRVDEAVGFYEKALARKPDEESALRSLTRALDLGNRASEMIAAADRALAAQPTSGPIVATAADAYWHGGRGLQRGLNLLESKRTTVRPEDRYIVDAARGRLWWVKGDAAPALAAFDSVLAYQADNPDGLAGRAAALALGGRSDEAFASYEKAVRMRTGIVDLRCDYARDLIRADRLYEAQKQLDEAKLLDPGNATAEALRGRLAMAQGDLDGARAHAKQALAWGPWCDLAAIVLGAAEKRAGAASAADSAWAPVLERIARDLPPGYVYRASVSSWEGVHELPAVERVMLEEARK